MVRSQFDMMDIDIMKQKARRKGAESLVAEYKKELKERATEKAKEKKVLERAETGMKRERETKRREFRAKAKKVAGILTATPKLGKGLEKVKSKVKAKKKKKIFKFGI